GGVLRAELLHDAGAVHLDRAWADAEVASGLLARGAGNDARQHVLLAPRQGLMAGKVKRGGRGDSVWLRAPPRLRLQRLAHAGHDLAAAKRLLDEVERAVLDRVDRHRNVALSGHDEDRHRIILGIELLKNVEAGAARDVDVENDADRCP